MGIEPFTEAGTKILARLGLPFPLLDAAPYLLELLPSAGSACDADGRILWLSQLPPELCPVAAVLKTGVPMCGAEGCIERRDGSSVWAMVHIEPVEDEAGRVVGAINCFHETTASHQSPDELEDFFENSAVGLHLVA